MSSYADRVAYARTAARRQGIDPDLFVRALKTEGLQPGTWRSRARNKAGILEPSYGPGQLLVGGPGTGYGPGLGNEFMDRYGKSPADPETWRENLDFTAENVRKGGWGKWYGPKKIGITGFMGVNEDPNAYNQAMNTPANQVVGKTKQMTPMEQAWMEKFGSLPPEGLQTSAGTNKGNLGDEPVMAEAMGLGAKGDFGGPGGYPSGGPMAPPPAAPMGRGEQIKRSLLGMGAGLSSISPSGRPGAALSMLKQLDEPAPGELTEYQRQMLDIYRDREDRAGAAQMAKAFAGQAEASQEAAAAGARASKMAQVQGDLVADGEYLLNQDLGWVTGYGSYLPNKPEGRNAALQAKMDNFMARGTYGFLQQLREMSSTGGAVGQVSNYETELFRQAVGALNQAQSQKEYKAALRVVIDRAKQAQKSIADAYKAQFGRELQWGESTTYGGGGEAPKRRRWDDDGFKPGKGDKLR